MLTCGPVLVSHKNLLLQLLYKAELSLMYLSWDQLYTTLHFTPFFWCQNRQLKKSEGWEKGLTEGLKTLKCMIPYKWVTLTSYIFIRKCFRLGFGSSLFHRHTNCHTLNKYLFTASLHQVHKYSAVRGKRRRDETQREDLLAYPQCFSPRFRSIPESSFIPAHGFWKQSYILKIIPPFFFEWIPVIGHQKIFLSNIF